MDKKIAKGSNEEWHQQLLHIIETLQKQPNGEVILTEIRHLHTCFGRLEKASENLEAMFASSTTKQGERIGVVEDDIIAIRKDFTWSMRLAVFVFALVQLGVTISLHIWKP